MVEMAIHIGDRRVRIIAHPQRARIVEGGANALLAAERAELEVGAAVDGQVFERAAIGEGAGDGVSGVVDVLPDAVGHVRGLATGGGGELHPGAAMPELPVVVGAARQVHVIEGRVT